MIANELFFVILDKALQSYGATLSNIKRNLQSSERRRRRTAKEKAREARLPIVSWRHVGAASSLDWREQLKWKFADTDHFDGGFFFPMCL